jgi:nitrate reductase NapE component
MKNAVTPKSAAPVSDRARRRSNWIIFTLAVLVAVGLYALILVRAMGLWVWAP